MSENADSGEQWPDDVYVMVAWFFSPRPEYSVDYDKESPRLDSKALWSFCVEIACYPWVWLNFLLIDQE